VRVVAFVPDLMDRSRVTAAAPGVEVVATPAALPAAGADADVVVVDLGRPGVLDALPVLAGGRARVVGFAAHVDRATLDAARAAGCDEVLPRSAFFRGLPELLGGGEHRG
jgi:DNA-binding NarL/FixJ family response regulator